MIRNLTLDEETALASGLALARELIGAPPPWRFEQVQGLYDTLLAAPAWEEGKIAAGLAFGCLMRGSMPLNWLRIEDEYGSETCLMSPTHEVHCAPISVIGKRLGRSEAVDIESLCGTIVERMREMESDAAPRKAAGEP